MLSEEFVVEYKAFSYVCHLLKCGQPVVAIRMWTSHYKCI